MLTTEADAITSQVKQNEREIRRLRVQMDKIAAGGTVRASAIGGVIPGANSPVEWYFNANLLGLGDELELHIGGGVWISASFAAGRAHYLIGAYCAPPCGGGGGATGTVAWYANGGWFCDALEADLEAQSGVWISASCVASRAVYKIGAYAVAGGTGLSGVSVALEGSDFCFAGGLDFHQGAGVWISGACVAGQADVTVGAYPGAAPPTSISGVDVLLNDGELCFAQAVDFHEGTGLWISGSCAGGEATVEFGAYPTDLSPYLTGVDLSPYLTGVDFGPYLTGVDFGPYISGVDFAANGEALCFGQGFDVQEATGVWVSGSCVGGEATYEVGAYPTNVPFSISGVDFDVNGGDLGYGAGLDIEQRPGVWVSGTMAGGRAKYEFGAYADVDPFISGVDFQRNGVPICFGYGLDIQEAAGVWVSGACVAGEADYQIGAYPANLAPYLSGVAFAARGGHLCFGQGLELNEGAGIWISGACVAGEAQYEVGLKVPFSIVDYVWAPDAAPAATIVAGDQQGNIYHSGPAAEIASRLYIDAETAPGASGLPVAVRFGDTNDLDTVATWTDIVRQTLSSEKSMYSDAMMSGTIPANRLLRMNIGTIVGTPKDASITLRVKRSLSA